MVKIQKVLDETEKELGLYYNYLSPHTAKWCMKHASVGALGDSFYEYLLKLWLFNRNKKHQQAEEQDAAEKFNKQTLRMYLDAVKAVRKNLVEVSPGSKLTYLGEYRSSQRLEKKMDHLACFSGGLFAMTSKYVDTLDDQERADYLELAKSITHTCHESYVRTPTHIGPEAFHFERPETEAMALKSNEKYYILRPEVIEAYFYLWRITKEQKYRDWAWDAVKAIEKHCRTENGYSGIRDVYEPLSGGKDDVQQSFFFAETLKYLYLIFSDDSVIPLDKYVLNTEAHPFLIAKQN
jgi:mannosyl-oligosaccharide alpha-1,2-mannosidase